MTLLLPIVVDTGCSLSNVKHDDCTSDDMCAVTFGPGSSCSSGYCTAPASCNSGHDCRKAAGGGACVNNVCVGTLPTNPACTEYTVPSNLFSQRADGPNAPIVIGGIFSLAAAHDQDLTKPIRLAVNEINNQGMGINSQQLAIVFCDNGGPGDMASGDDRAALNVAAFDYLAGTLGVPYIVGPLTSNDALTLIGEQTKTQYPTVLISPSATSATLTTTNASIDGTRMFWRTCPNDDLQAQVLATDVIGAVSTIKSVSVIYINDAYGAGLESGFAAAYKAGTVSLVPYSATTTSSSSALAALAAQANATPSDAVLLIAEEGTAAVAIVEALVGTPLASKPFFFTDGSMDSNLVSPSLSSEVKAIIQAAQGTAPADPDTSNSTYAAFNADLMSQFGIAGNSTSFLAQAYDATYVGAYGIVYASMGGSQYTGVDVAKAMGRLEAGSLVPIGFLDFPPGKSELLMQGQINVDGTSGPLQFNPSTGEAPGAILVWNVMPSFAGYGTVTVIQPN